MSAENSFKKSSPQLLTFDTKCHFLRCQLRQSKLHVHKLRKRSRFNIPEGVKEKGLFPDSSSAPGRSVSRPSRSTDRGSRLWMGAFQQDPPAADVPPRNRKPRHKFFLWLPAPGHGFHHLPRTPLSELLPYFQGRFLGLHQAFKCKQQLAILACDVSPKRSPRG